MTEIMGTADLWAFLDKYDVTLTPELKYLENYDHPKTEWHELVRPANAHYATDDAIDLLGQILVMDPAGRIAAKDALEHPYFDMIKPNPGVFKEDQSAEAEKDEL